MPEHFIFKGPFPGEEVEKHRLKYGHLPDRKDCCISYSYANDEELTPSTSTVSTNPYFQKYDEWIVAELMEYVRDASLESDAVHNIKTILKSYENRKTVWEVFKQLINKILKS